MKLFVNSLLLAAIGFAHEHTGDSHLSFEEICDKYGYQHEEHTVITLDGYILTQFRIPGLVDEKIRQNKEYNHMNEKRPVFFQHGLLDSANCWIMNYDEIAPAFVAARAGYDVWLGNSRGNTFSEGHVTLDRNKDEEKYWNFDWHEMGLFDIPATLDYITEQTGHQKIAYIGHSQGTTQMFVGLSKHESYFKHKVSIFIALAPATMVPNTQAEMLRYASEHYNLIDDYFEAAGINSFMTRNWLTDTSMKIMADKIPDFFEIVEKNFVSSHPHFDNHDRFEVYIDHMPNGTSKKALLHYAQNLLQKRFQKYADNYHPFSNPISIHHHDEVPAQHITEEYQIQNIKEVPIAMFVGRYDVLADPVDARWTRDQIGEAVVHYQEIDGGHETFLLGKDMTFFTKDVMDLLEWYHPVPMSWKQYQQDLSNNYWI